MSEADPGQVSDPPELQTVWDGGKDWNPRSRYTWLVHRIQELLADGEDRTTRDVYYALEAHGFDYEYRKVKTAVKRGRRAGYIDPDQIIDSSRRASWTATDGEFNVRWAGRTFRYDGRDEFIENVVRNLPEVYFESFWKEQGHYVEVWLEKASLSSVFHPVCRDYNVRLEATRGDWSDSKIYRAQQRLVERLGQGKDVRIMYFGDFNPSGYHAPVAVQNTLGKYGLGLGRNDGRSDAAFFDIWPYDGAVEFHQVDGTLRFERVALNLEHVERYDLPENPTPSKSDKDRTLRDRFMRYVSDGRDVNIELNALKEFHRDEFESLIAEAIEQYVDADARARVEAEVEQAREDLADAIHVGPTAGGTDQ